MVYDVWCQVEGMMCVQHWPDEKCSHRGVPFIIRAAQEGGLGLSCLIVEVTENRDESLAWPSAQLGTHRGRIWPWCLCPMTVSLCFSHQLEAEDRAEVRSWVLVLTSPLPCSWTWVLIKRQGLFHLILLICGTWKNGTGELICKTEIESQMERTNLRYQRGKERWGEPGDWDWQKCHYLTESG